MKAAFRLVLLAVATTGCQSKDAAQNAPEAAGPGVREARSSIQAASTMTGLFGGGFAVPAICALECTACVVPLQGVIRCRDSEGLLDQSGTFMFRELDPSSAEPLPARHSQPLGSGFLYSLRSPEGRGDCSVVRIHDPKRDRWLVWDFCTHSADGQVLAAHRQTAASFRLDPDHRLPSPCTVGAF